MQIPAVGFGKKKDKKYRILANIVQIVLEVLKSARKLA
jgi:hypothetical protein